jgi:hypothetical protein
VSRCDQARDRFEPEETDAAEVVRASIETKDELGPLRFEVVVWTRTYGSYLRYAFRASRAFQPAWNHPFSALDPDERDGCAEISNIVADNEATRALLRLIALPDAELDELCGTHREASRYRARLIRCVRSLWD